jgi:hypothetical protein
MAATLTISPNDVLQLGGPGFIQVGGPPGSDGGAITPNETEVHGGDNMWINLGNIVQGTASGAGGMPNEFQVELSLLNASGATIPDVTHFWKTGDFSFQGPNGIVQYAPGSFKGVGAVLADTSQLGAHVAQLQLGHRRAASGTTW